MTPRENYLAVINHEKPEWIPNFITDAVMCGAFAETFDVGPAGGGYDGYGVLYTSGKTNSDSGFTITAAPDPRHKAITDITDWKNQIMFPDLDAFDWEAMAAANLAKFDPEKQVKDYWQFYGPFQRMGNLLGFQDALLALFEEPEASYELMEACTDFRIKALPYIKKYVDPDIYSLCDDVAHEKGTFMSLDTYEKLIMPHHKKMLDAVRDYGMIPSMHCCGKAETLIPSFIEAGAVVWNPAHSINDIESILKNYGDKIVVVGGYNMNGRPGNETTPVEEILEEVHRCFDTYSKYGSYIFMGSVATTGPEGMKEKMLPLIMESVKLAHSTPAVHRPV